MNDRQWLKVPAAAEYANVSCDTIYSACARGELRHVRIRGRRSIRLKTEWIDEWLEQFIRGASDRELALELRG